jgi:hypothetical protein
MSTWFLQNISDIPNRKFRRDKMFVKFDSNFAVVIFHANCVWNLTLNPVEAVSFNHYYATYVLPYLPVMRVE